MEFAANAAPSRVERIEIEKIEWIQNVLNLLPEERRNRLLLCLAAYGSKVSARDPLFGTLDAIGILSTVWIDVAAKMGETAQHVNQARTASREAVEIASRELRQEVKQTSDSTKQLLEDVRATMVEAVSPEKLGAAFAQETQAQFGNVLKPLMEKQLSAALEVITPRMTKWAEETVDGSLKKATAEMDKAVQTFRGKIFGDLRWFHFGLIAVGSLSTVGAFVLGYPWPR
jgi:hypothetical protein